MPSFAAFFTADPTRHAPSSVEYSVWQCKWTNESGMSPDCGGSAACQRVGSGKMAAEKGALRNFGLDDRRAAVVERGPPDQLSVLIEGARHSEAAGDRVQSGKAHEFFAADPVAVAEKQ